MALGAACYARAIAVVCDIGYRNVAVVSRTDGSIVTLGEIGRLNDGFEDVDLFARFQEKPAALIRVFRVADQNALSVVKQVKAHIERRFGMSWPESPVNKLRDQIGALRAIWAAWQNNSRLNFRSDHYKLTLMTPFFNPGQIDHPDIPIYVAGVNRGLARLTGELADGFLAHPFHSPEYLRDVILPEIEKGSHQAGRDPKAVSIAVNAFVISDPEQREFVRQQISFYASTPSYRPVMALHGWEEAAKDLSAAAARGNWADMPGIVTDKMLEVFATVAKVEDLPAALRKRYAGIADRLSLYLPFTPGEGMEFWKGFVEAW